MNCRGQRAEKQKAKEMKMTLRRGKGILIKVRIADRRKHGKKWKMLKNQGEYISFYSQILILRSISLISQFNKIYTEALHLFSQVS